MIQHGPNSGAVPHRLTAAEAVRFWEKVAVAGDDECWAWCAHRDRAGYGKFGIPSMGRPINAHRIAFAETRGHLRRGQLVRHTCDHPWCVNPRHLQAGSHHDNMQDMASRGRHGTKPRVRCHCGKVRVGPRGRPLCEQHYREARQAVADKESAKRLERRMVQRAPLVRLTRARVERVTSPRNATLFGIHFGLWGYGRPRTLADIGHEYGMTRERCRQIVVRVCEKLGIAPRTFWGYIKGA